MTTAEKRLDDLALRLTVRERVILALRPWLAGEEDLPDTLARNCPEPERQEMERLLRVIERGNQLLGDGLAFSLEWANNEDIRMGWLECLAAFVARDRIRLPHERGIPALPPPGRGFIRDLPVAWGRKVGEDEPIPETWDEAVETLTRQMRKSIEIRWRTVLTFEEAFALGCAAFGQQVVHSTLRDGLAAVRAKVLDLHQVMQPFDAFALPALTPEDREQANDYFDLAALRAAGDAKGQRERLIPSKLAEVEAEEARLAAELRSEWESS